MVVVIEDGSMNGIPGKRRHRLETTSAPLASVAGDDLGSVGGSGGGGWGGRRLRLQPMGERDDLECTVAMVVAAAAEGAFLGAGAGG
uniref:DUF834 domain-containing protein n=1 Tax=Oryza meridionalis TaxID=40149 RepID=A0A0E0CHS9_9ORYZ